MLNLDLLKLSNIFNPNSMPSPTSPDMGTQPSLGSNQQSDPGNQLDLMSAIKGLLNPRDEQFSNFEDLIKKMPQRSDYQPSKLRQVAAAIAGMGMGGPAAYSGGAALGYKSDIPGGLKVQGVIQDEPYNQALTDWSRKVEPTKDIAQMEQSRNIGNRATALGALQRQTAQEAQDEKERANLIKEKQNEQNIQIRQERADAYVTAKKFAIEHPTFKPFVDENGDLYFYDPANPKSDPIPGGLKKLSDTEKLDLQVQGKIQLAGIAAENASKLEDQKQGNRLDLATTSIAGRKDIKSTPTGNKITPEKDMVPSQEKQALINRAKDVISANPGLKNYILIDKDGVSITPTGIFGDEAKRLRAYDLIFGSGKPSKVITPASNAVAKPAENTRELTRPEDDRIKTARSKVEAGNILITDGKSFGQVKPSDIDKLPKGWMVVK